MSGLPLLVLLIFVMAIVIALLRKRAATAALPEVWPLSGVRPLSNIEQVLFHRLAEALPDHVILAQVQLSRFLKVNRGVRQPQRWFNRINQKSIDYLICDRAFTIIAGIELDDASHRARHRLQADEQKNAALKAAAIRLVRWQASSLPNGPQIRHQLGIQVAGLDGLPSDQR